LSAYDWRHEPAEASPLGAILATRLVFGVVADRA